MKKTNINLLPILTVNFIGTFGFSIILPFLIFIVTRLGGNEIIYGILGATYSFFQLIGAPILGRSSDIHGRRKILFVSQFGTFLSWIILIFALVMPFYSLVEVDSRLLGQFTLSFPLMILFFARALDGVTGGNISVANAYVVDISTKENQRSNFGKMAASSNMGFVVGPLIGGLLGATIWRELLPAFLAAAISLVAIFLIMRLPEVKPTHLDEAPCKNPNRRLFGKEIKDCYDCEEPCPSGRKVSKIPGLLPMLVLYFFIFLAFNIFYVAMPVHAVKGLHWEIANLGFFFALLSVLMVLVQGPLLSTIGHRIKEETLFLAGSLTMCGSFMLLLSTQPVFVYSSAALFALGNGVMWPSYLSILGRIGTESEKGYIQGIASSSGSFASIIGFIFGGLLYAQLGPLTFALAGALFIGIFFVFLLLKPLVANSV